MENPNNQTLWENVPGATQLFASVVSSEQAKAGFTLYLIDLKIFDGENTIRQWSVKRRYSDFFKVERVFKELGFPCPELPPRQLWAFHTNSFIAQRQLALHLWLQGTVRIWQSVSPLRAEEAYSIGEILEAFLCEQDSESFAKTLEELQTEIHTATLSPMAPLMPQAETFAQLARAKKRESGGVRRSASSTQVATLTSNMSPSSTKVITGSLNDLSLLNTQDHSKVTPAGPSQPSWARGPSSGAIGVAIDLRAAMASTDGDGNSRQYSTFDVEGNRVQQSFRPFTATVVYDQGTVGLDAMERSGMLNACTPVSVPPTPHGQTEFNASWSQYTSSVLEFVAERLDIVTRAQREKNERAFNILDRHIGSEGAQLSEDDDDDAEHHRLRMAQGVTGNISRRPSASGAPQYIRNLRLPPQKLPASLVEDADAGAGGSSRGDGTRHDARYYQYVQAGDHLISTILMENDSAVDVVGSSDWLLISNTKDVIVMRRNRPIKKRYLLNGQTRPLGGVLPSPSPPSSQGQASLGMYESPNRLARDRDQQHCFMGRGVINAPAAEIFEIVRKPENRHLYDSILNEELLLENLQVGFRPAIEDVDKPRPSVGNLLVYYHMFETNRCFLRYARDFCVLQYARAVKTKKTVKFVVVGASIDHSECPQRDDVERAHLDLFGWVIEPLGPDRSKVTYMIHIDFGPGGVPTHLLNTISFRQPLCVHYLRKHMDRAKAEALAKQTETASTVA